MLTEGIEWTFQTLFLNKYLKIVVYVILNFYCTFMLVEIIKYLDNFVG